MNKLIAATLIVACTFFNPCASQGDVIAITGAGGITDFFGNGNGVADAADSAGLLFDEARTGGGDTNTASTFNPDRNLVGVAGTNSQFADGLTLGTAGTITFDGIGLAMRGGTTDGATINLDIIYLGADEVFGGGDDVTAATVTDTVNFTVTGEYAWNFTTAQTFAWDGLGDRFRFALTSTGGTMRFKTRPVNESPSGQNGLTMSVAGSFSAAVPEPGSAIVLGLVVAGTLVRRRRR